MFGLSWKNKSMENLYGSFPQTSLYYWQDDESNELTTERGSYQI